MKPSGIIIGSFGMPPAVALNVAAIRYFNGPDTPILVHDDCTPAHLDPTGYFERQHNFEIVRPTMQLGHVTGDINCFIEGLKWAKAKKLKYLIKLSQRFLFTKRNWLAESVKNFEINQIITASQSNAIHGVRPWGYDGIRSECVCMRVDDWCKEPVFEALRTYPATPEHSVAGVASSLVHPGQPIARWRMFGPDKAAKREGVLWHDANGDEDYQGLAKTLNVDLIGFSSSGWNHILGTKWKLF